MPEIRQDPTTREWVIIATERAKRPHEFTSLSSAADQASRSCVFCRGNEARHRRKSGYLKGNKFPALSSKATATRYETPPFYRSMDGFGYHEVIIETPEHDQTLASMQEDELVDVLLTYRERHLALKADPRVKLVLSEQEVTSHIRIHRSLLRLHRALDDPHFNLVIHTAPVEDELQAYFLWHVEITPRITTPAGFELGSGILVNPCVPEEAAEFLRDTCLC
jgi:galactose-1-phosphate uridylyltransferase